MNITIKILTQEKETEYTDFLLKNSFSLFYASIQYRNLIANYLQDIESLYLIAEADNQIVGSLPIMLSSQGKFGKIMNSLPYYGSNGGIVVHTNLTRGQQEAISQALIAKAMDLVEQYDCGAYTFISNPLDKYTKEVFDKMLSFDFIDHRVGQITTLPDNTATQNLDEDLLNLFEDPRPRNIRKAIKSNIAVRIGHSKADLDFLFSVHQENIHSIGGIAKEQRFFELIPSCVDKQFFNIYLAEMEDTPIAALLLFYHNQTVEYFTPATVHEFRNLQPSSLLIFEAMKDAVRAGYKYWNWGGTWITQQGVYGFKKKWGAEDYPYYYYTKILNQQILSSNKSDLLEAYPNFFVLPFNKIKSDE